jgi:hypothetical protein
LRQFDAAVAVIGYFILDHVPGLLAGIKLWAVGWQRQRCALALAACIAVAQMSRKGLVTVFTMRPSFARKLGVAQWNLRDWQTLKKSAKPVEECSIKVVVE